MTPPPAPTAKSHIPGPYAVDPDTRPDMEHNNHIVLAGNPDMRVAFMAHGGRYSQAQWDATAALLAAAPELLRKLTVLADEMAATGDALPHGSPMRNTIEEWHAQARAALAKAAP